MDLLARREHSRFELARKLRVKVDDPVAIDTVLQALKEDGLQSDLRFAEAYVRMRINRGFGPLRLSQELEAKGVSDDIAIATIGDYFSVCLEQIEIVWNKRFGSQRPSDYDEQAKQMRFLQYRGFPSEKIREFFSEALR